MFFAMRLLRLATRSKWVMIALIAVIAGYGLFAAIPFEETYRERGEVISVRERVAGGRRGFWRGSFQQVRIRLDSGERINLRWSKGHIRDGETLMVCFETRKFMFRRERIVLCED